MMIWFVEWFFVAMMIASLSAFLLLLAAKWKLVEWMQVHGNDFFSKMANCDFCLSWWVNVLVSVTAFAVMWNITVLVIPFFSTMITRKLI